MHKNIALLIAKIIDESSYSFFSCNIIPDKDGANGFWKCIIKFDKRNNAPSEALVRSLKHIGIVYGEGLSVEDNGKFVEVQ